MLKRILAIAAIVLGTAAIVLWVMNLGPHGDPKPSVTDWIGAVGTAFGAALTGGALLIAAFTYQHQVDEKNRQALDARSAQARKVTLTHSPRAGWHELEVSLRNDSDLPIREVNVVSVNADSVETKRHQPGTIDPKKASRDVVPLPATGHSYASFKDSDDRNWKLYFDGRLEEQVPSTVRADADQAG